MSTGASRAGTQPASAEPRAATEVAAPPSLGELFAAFLKVGFLSFGGPAGQIALMHHMIVDEKRWVDERTYLQALNLCMLLPGPEAQQLATYVGWRLHGWRGGIIAGGLFVLPGAILMLALAAGYALYGKVGIVPALFAGVKAGVLAIVIGALIRIAKRALRGRADLLIAAAAFLALFLFGVPFPLVIATAALAGWAIGHPAELHGPAPEGRDAAAESPVSWTRALLIALLWSAIWASPALLALIALGPRHVFAEIAAFFAKLAVVTFGGAYAVLAYMAQQAVETHHWLTASEMLDGLGLAETTPGPLILVTQFVGFLAGFRNPAPFEPLTAGILAAVLTTWTTFAPSFLWIMVLAPFVERIGRMPALSAALAGITAAVVGVIFNLTVWFGLRVFFAELRPVSLGPLRLDAPVLSSADFAAMAIAALAAFCLFRLKFGVAAVVGISALAGLLVEMLPRFG